MRPRVRIASALGLTLGLLSAAPPVAAQGDPHEDARQHYERGLSLANGGSYEAALEEFRQAYAKSPRYPVLYNIGQAEIALGRPVEALATLSQYLREGGEQITAERRKHVEAQLTSIEATLSEVHVTSEPPGARITFDGRDVGRTPLSAPLRTKAGTHELVAVQEGAEPVTRSFSLREGERLSIHFELPVKTAPRPTQSLAPCAPVPPEASRRAPPLDGSSSEPSVLSTAGYAAAGAGLLVSGVAVAHYLYNRDRHDAWQREHVELRYARALPDYRARQLANNELADSIDRASRVTVGLGIAGGSLLLGGLSLLATDALRPRDDSPKADRGSLRMDWVPSIGARNDVVWSGVW